MPRRRLTVKRLDPWSVLKFGAVANLALLAIGLLVLAVAWFIIDRIGLVEQVCEIADTFGFERCGINAGNLFRAFVLLGLLWVVIQTAVLVFLSFLHNLIADLTGGLALTVIEEGPQQAMARAQVGPGASARGASGEQRYVTDPRRPVAPTGPQEPTPSAPATTGAPPVPPIGRDAPTEQHEPVASRRAEEARRPRRPSGAPEQRGGRPGGDAFGPR